MNLTDKINKLMESEISAYQISKSTGVDTSTISRLRNKKSDVGNTTLDVAEKLGCFYDENVKNIK